MRRLRFLRPRSSLRACALLTCDFAVFPAFVPAALAAGLRVRRKKHCRLAFRTHARETHRDPQAIPATMHRTNVREDNTLTIYRRKLAPITEISSSARLRTSSAWI